MNVVTTRKNRKGKKIWILLFFIIVVIGAISYFTDTTKPTQLKVSHAVTHSNDESNNKAAEKTSQISLLKDLVTATITRNVDGDTVHVNINGKDEDIRMLLIDTPETHDPRKPVEPYGPEASSFAEKELTVGTKVMLEEGVKGHDRDKYGRLLAFIYLPSGKMYNEEVVKKGLARVAYIYEPNTMHLSELKKFESYAKSHKLGIWSISGYVTADGYTIDSKQSSSAKTSHSSIGQTSSSSHTYENDRSDDKESNKSCQGKIKGNTNSKIYHVPGGEFYERTQDNIVWFCSESDAEKAGYRKSQR
jgi:micrococcal nuclease